MLQPRAQEAAPAEQRASSPAAAVVRAGLPIVGGGSSFRTPLTHPRPAVSTPPQHVSQPVAAFSSPTSLLSTASQSFSDTL